MESQTHENVDFCLSEWWSRVSASSGWRDLSFLYSVCFQCTSFLQQSSCCITTFLDNISSITVYELLQKWQSFLRLSDLLSSKHWGLSHLSSSYYYYILMLLKWMNFKFPTLTAVFTNLPLAKCISFFSFCFVSPFF